MLAFYKEDFTKTRIFNTKYKKIDLTKIEINAICYVKNRFKIMYFRDRLAGYVMTGNAIYNDNQCKFLIVAYTNFDKVASIIFYNDKELHHISIMRANSRIKASRRLYFAFIKKINMKNNELINNFLTNFINIKNNNFKVGIYKSFGRYSMDELHIYNKDLLFEIVIKEYIRFNFSNETIVINFNENNIKIEIRKQNVAFVI